MNLTGKIIVSLVVAAIASTAATLLLDRSLPDLVLIGCFLAATLVTAALVTLPAAAVLETGSDRVSQAADGDREQGQVKWFNVSKGFGFIIRDDGEEIFVHFRSIRGEGRRSLRDGQRVEFEVTDSDKGPQADDVVALN